jgi:hypothetical protein
MPSGKWQEAVSKHNFHRYWQPSGKTADQCAIVEGRQYLEKLLKFIENKLELLSWVIRQTAETFAKL